MGQYQQWLHYREQDRQLRTQLEKLEAELAALQARAGQLADPGPYEQNPLLRLLWLASRLEAVQTGEQPVADSETPLSPALSFTPETPLEEHTAPGTTGETPALFPWNGLPGVHLPATPATTRSGEGDTTIPSSPLPHPEIALLPEDMAAFLDEHTQTSPQLAQPWWMRQPVPASPAGSGHMQGRAAEQETIRHKRDIARWLERWGRQPAEQEGDAPHE